MNYYQILEIPEDSTIDQIKQQYKQLIKTYHPDLYKGDKNFANEKTKQITQAYKILVNPVSRNDYDMLLHSENLESSVQYKYHSNDDESLEDDYSDFYENKDDNFFETNKYKQSVSDVVDETYDKIAKKSVDFFLNSNKLIQLLVLILIILFIFAFFFTQIMDIINRSGLSNTSTNSGAASHTGIYNHEIEIQQSILDSITIEDLQREFGTDILDRVEDGTFESIDELKEFYYRNSK